MHAGIRFYMFPQVIDTHIHQLTGIQSGAAELRVGGSVGAFSGEVEDDADIGQSFFDQAGFGTRVPGQGKVQNVKTAGAGQECFSGTAFLCRAAVIDYGSAKLFFFQPVFDEAGSLHGAGTEQVVSAAVTCCAGAV